MSTEFLRLSNTWFCCCCPSRARASKPLVTADQSRRPAFELELMPPLLSPSVCLHPGNSLGPTPCNLHKVTSRISEKFNFFTALTICMNNFCWNLRASCSITQLFRNQPYTINFLHVDPLKVSLQVGDDHHLDVDHHPGFPQLLVSGQVSQKLRGVNKILRDGFNSSLLALPQEKVSLPHCPVV